MKTTGIIDKKARKWALVYCIGSSIIETVQSNIPYSLAAGIRRKKQESGNYSNGKLRIVAI